MPLFQLMYMSALRVVDVQTVFQIVDTAVRNNTRNGLTGMMLYADGSIVQVLEGEKASVQRTFNAILADPRHSGVQVLVEQDIEARDFSEWSMGYQQMNAADVAASPVLQNIFRANCSTLNHRVQPGEALTLLKSFAQGSALH